ncbi:Rad1/Rec1/Rad17 [Gorgonomyces haynaldii]|nr:Rad1/Rec1/Rad17 [Gorgonomyces haynaldii]
MLAAQNQFQCVFRSKMLHDLLKPLQFASHCYWTVSPDGIVIAVHESKAMEARALITSDFFESFEFHQQEDLVFGLDIKTLLECLGLFVQEVEIEQQTQLSQMNPVFQRKDIVHMAYPQQGGELQLSLVDDDQETHVTLFLFEGITDFSLADQFSDESVRTSAIVDAKWMQNTFAELDSSLSEFKIEMRERAPFLQISGETVTGKMSVAFARNNHVMESFECHQNIAEKYKSSLIKPVQKALLMSSKVHIRVNERGMLALQIMMKMRSETPIFLEYYVSPLSDDQL